MKKVLCLLLAALLLLPVGTRRVILSDLTALGGGEVGLLGVDAAQEALHE